MKAYAHAHRGLSHQCGSFECNNLAHSLANNLPTRVLFMTCTSIAEGGGALFKVSSYHEATIDTLLEQANFDKTLDFGVQALGDRQLEDLSTFCFFALGMLYGE